jgi:hypothetical protein
MRVRRFIFLMLFGLAACESSLAPPARNEVVGRYSFADGECIETLDVFEFGGNFEYRGSCGDKQLEYSGTWAYAVLDGTPVLTLATFVSVHPQSRFGGPIIWGAQMLRTSDKEMIGMCHGVNICLMKQRTN